MRIVEVDGKPVTTEESNAMLSQENQAAPADHAQAPPPKTLEPKPKDAENPKAEGAQPPDWLEVYLEQVQAAQGQQEAPPATSTEDEREPQVELSPEEQEKLNSLPPEIQQKIKEFQNAINAKNAQKWRKIWAKTKEAELKARAYEEMLSRVESMAPPPPTHAVQPPFSQQGEPILPGPALPPPIQTGQDGLPDFTLLPEFQELQNAEPEEYHQKFAAYERARNRAMALWIQQHSQARERAMELQREVMEVDQKLSQEWTGDLVHPIPWTETKALFEQLAQKDPDVFRAVASAQGSPLHRAEFIAAIVQSRFPDVYARRLHEVQENYRLRRGQQAAKNMASALQGASNPPMNGASGEVALGKAWLRYIGK